MLDAPTNLDFEDGGQDGADGGEHGGVAPAHWFRCGHDGYELATDYDERHGGRASGRVRSLREPAGHEFGGLGQLVSAADFRGGQVRLIGWLRTAAVSGHGAGLWLRIDGPDGSTLDFDNMQQPVDRSVTGTTGWNRYEIVLNVPQDATGIAFGFLICGRGTVWGDDLSLTKVVEQRDVTHPAATMTVVAAVPSVPYEIRFHGREQEQESFRRLLAGVTSAGRAKAWSPVRFSMGSAGSASRRCSTGCVRSPVRAPPTGRRPGPCLSIGLWCGSCGRRPFRSMTGRPR